MTTRERLQNLPRPFRAVELPGGATVHVRDLSLADLLGIDKEAGKLPEGHDRNVRRALLLCGLALCEPDGAPCFPDLSDADAVAAAVAALTNSQIRAVTDAAVPTAADGKNG